MPKPKTVSKKIRKQLKNKNSRYEIINTLRKTINDAYGEEVITVASSLPMIKIHTGVFSLDLEAEGGIPRGRFVTLVGDESTGKSTLLYTIAGKFQRICGNCMQGNITEKEFKKISQNSLKNHSFIDKNILYADAFFANKEKNNIYSHGEEIIDKKLIEYVYDIECNKCTDPSYSAVLLVDSENNYTKEWATRFNMIHAYTILALPKYSEQVGDIIREALSTGRVSFIGVDSVDAIGPGVEDESSIEDQQMGVQARVWNKITRAIHSRLNRFFTYEFYDKIRKEKRSISMRPEPTVCIVQQWREKIGAYGDPRVMGGGKGKSYASSLTIGLTKGEKDWRNKKDKDLRGIYFNFEFLKQKTGTPYRYGRFYFSVDDRLIINDETVIDYAMQYNFIVQKGAWFKFNKKKFQGRERLLKYIQKNNMIPKIEKLIMKKVLDEEAKKK